MTLLYAAALAVLLAARMTPAFAACVNAQCTDTAAIERARATIQATCGCTRAGQTHGKYAKCVKSTLKLADLTALIPQKACRKLIMRCENASICGKPNAAVCCIAKGNGKVKSSIVGNPAKCKKGSACGAFLGLFSKFDACAADGTCAGPPTTTTTTTSTTTTLPSGGGVLRGALTATPGRFNYNLTLGIPGANSACNTNFPGTHACTYPELQSAQTAGDLVGLKDITGMTVTSFWAIDSSQPGLQQCIDDVMGGSGLNWEYATAHTASRGQKVALDNATGALGPLQSSLQCNFSGNSWVGCCQ
jgi:hypothetical protein